MQQRTEIIPYKRVGKKDKNTIKKEIIIQKDYLVYGAMFLCSFLISRVTFIDGYFTSGIGILIASVLLNRKKANLVVLIGSIIGYLSLVPYKMEDAVFFMALSVVIFLCNKVVNVTSKAVKLSLNFLYFIIAMVPYNIFFNNLSIVNTSIDILWKIATIIPIFAISYFVFYQLENKKGLTSSKLENLIVLSLVIGLLVLGVRNFSIYEVNLANILGISLLLTFSYVLNSGGASLLGLISGALIGINDSFIVYSGLYGITGTLINVLRNASKYVVGVLFFLGFVLLKVITQESINISIIETAIAAGIFFIMPLNYIRSLMVKEEVKVDETLEDRYVNELKYFYMAKIDSFSNIFKSMNETILNMNRSASESVKTDDEIIEEVIERRCNSCSLRNTCWKKNISSTYNVFKRLMQSYREETTISVEELERKCIDYYNLMNDFDHLLSENANYNIWSKRLNDNRTILADQMMNMSDSLRVMSEELDEGIVFRKDIESNLKNKLKENNVLYNYIICTANSEGRVKINLTINKNNEILTNLNSLNYIINESTKNNFYLSEKIDNDYRDLSLIFEETPRFHIISAVKSVAKDGEKLNGDSYICKKLRSDKMITIISDGVGSGKSAMAESKAAVDIMESYLKSGFNSITALTMINSIMSINFSQNEMFSTLDLSTIDLYSGDMEIAKLGAAPTFIKNGSDVEFIHSKSLPMGVVDKINVDIVNKTLHNGDMMIMISDGAMSNLDGKGNYAWLCSFLKKSIATDPQNLCNEIVDKIKEVNEGKVTDDVTVIVEKVYKIF